MLFYDTSMIPFFHLVMMMREWSSWDKCSCFSCSRPGSGVQPVGGRRDLEFLVLPSGSLAGRSMRWHQRERCQDSWAGRQECRAHTNARQNSILFGRVDERRAVKSTAGWWRGCRWNLLCERSLSFPLDLSPGKLPALEEMRHMQLFIHPELSAPLPIRFTHSYTFDFHVASPLSFFLPSRFNFLQLHLLLEQDDSPKNKQTKKKKLVWSPYLTDSGFLV